LYRFLLRGIPVRRYCHVRQYACFNYVIIIIIIIIVFVAAVGLVVMVVAVVLALMVFGRTRIFSVSFFWLGKEFHTI
jgi:type IV secretory pathway VirB3-like protein